MNDNKIGDIETKYLKVCVDITVYWKGSVFDRVEGVLDFYSQVISIIGDKVRFYTTEKMEGAQKIKQDTFDLIPFWFSKSKKKRDMYILTLEGGGKKDALSDIGLYLCADEQEESRSGAVRLVLPVSYAINPQQYIDMVISLVRKLNFQSGHAGYAVNWFPTADSADDALALFPAIARRYPGIDLSDMDITLYAISSSDRPSIKCINWLTLLGADIVKSAGEIKALFKDLPDDCLVHPLNLGGVLIQAGGAPYIGDGNHNEQLKSYHAVGKILAPLRLQNHPDFVGATLENPEEDLTSEWLSRFDSL
jgi:hypothetical protein